MSSCVCQLRDPLVTVSTLGQPQTQKDELNVTHKHGVRETFYTTQESLGRGLEICTSIIRTVVLILIIVIFMNENNQRITNTEIAVRYNRMDDSESKNVESPTNVIEENNGTEDPDELQCPDGGWGWMVCFAGYMVNFSTVGLVASNGILLLGLIDLFNDTVSKTAMVGSLFMGISMCVGPLVLLSMEFNASHRQVIMIGGFLSFVSTFASSFAEQIEVLYITYGIFSGCFIGMAYFAANTIVGAYFRKKRTLAIGIASSGAGCGAFALNYLLELCISYYGMRGTFLLISGLMLNFLIYGALCRPLKKLKTKSKMDEMILEETTKDSTLTNSIEPDEKENEDKETTKAPSSDDMEPPEYRKNETRTACRKEKAMKILHHIRLAIFDLEVMKNMGMKLLLTVYLFWAVGEVTLIYLPSKIVSVGIERLQAAWVMSIYGAVFAFSQIFVGVLADLIHIPTSYLLSSALLGMSAVIVAFTVCQSFVSFVISSCLLAICNGFCSALRVVFVASILGAKNLAKGYSPLCLLIGLAYIIYPIITGALLNATGTFDAIFYFASAFLFVGSAISGGLVYMQRNKKFYEQQ